MLNCGGWRYCSTVHACNTDAWYTDNQKFILKCTSKFDSTLAAARAQRYLSYCAAPA